MRTAKASWLILLESFVVILPLLIAATGMIRTASPYLVAANVLKLAIYNDFTPVKIVNTSTQLRIKPHGFDKRCQGSVAFRKENTTYDCYFMRDNASACEHLEPETFRGEAISVLTQPMSVPFGTFDCVLSSTLDGFKTSYYFSGMATTGSSIFVTVFVISVLVAFINFAFVDIERLEHQDYPSIR